MPRLPVTPELHPCRLSQADGAGNNIWVPGQFGWVET